MFKEFFLFEFDKRSSLFLINAQDDLSKSKRIIIKLFE